MQSDRQYAGLKQRHPVDRRIRKSRKQDCVLIWRVWSREALQVRSTSNIMCIPREYLFAARCHTASLQQCFCFRKVG